MRITREIDYALRIMDFLAGQSEDKNNRAKGINANTIAETVAVPPRFTLKILHKLVVGGLVKSYKGVKGGYKLAKAPAEINLRHIVEIVDGPVVILNCLDEDSGCSCQDFNKAECFFHHVFNDINSTIIEKLEAVTLDMVPRRI